MVSIVIPCYNCAGTIDRAVLSACSQTWQALEIICVDNNSEDGTFSRLQMLAKIDERITIMSESRKGASFARNTGLRHASGRWIQFLDADDTIRSEKLQAQLSCCDESTDFVIGSYFYHSDSGVKSIYPTSDSLFLGFMNSRLGRTSSNLYKRSSLLAINGWNESAKSSQEYDLILRLLQNNSNCHTVDYRLLTDIYYTRNSISTTVAARNSNLLRRLDLRMRLLYWIINVGNEKDFNEIKTSFLELVIELTQFSLIKAFYYLKKADISTRDIVYIRGMSLKYYVAIKILGIKNTLKISYLSHKSSRTATRIEV